MQPELLQRGPCESLWGYAPSCSAVHTHPSPTDTPHPPTQSLAWTAHAYEAHGCKLTCPPLSLVLMCTWMPLDMRPTARALAGCWSPMMICVGVTADGRWAMSTAWPSCWGSVTRISAGLWAARSRSGRCCAEDTEGCGLDLPLPAGQACGQACAGAGGELGVQCCTPAGSGSMGPRLTPIARQLGCGWPLNGQDLGKTLLAAQQTDGHQPRVCLDADACRWAAHLQEIGGACSGPQDPLRCFAPWSTGEPWLSARPGALAADAESTPAVQRLNPAWPPRFHPGRPS